MSLLSCFIWFISIFSADSALSTISRNLKSSSLANRAIRKVSNENIPKIFAPRLHVPSPLFVPNNNQKLTIIPSYYSKGFEFYFNDKSRLFNGPIPMHFLNDPEFFDEAVRRGERSLCQYLLSKGQRVNILNDNGDNILVRIIEKGMPELVGLLLEKDSTKQEALRALDVVDASTLMTPIGMAIKLGDRIAIYEIVSIRK